MEFNVENYLSNLSYINKDFPSLWNEILETVPKLTNKWLPSEANESDPLIVLLKELAIIADKLNYSIDKNILELFPATLTQLRSAYNVYESLGYTPDWYVSATTGITITYTGMVGGSRIEDGASTDPVEIPRWTQVSDDDGEIIYTIMDSIRGIIPGTPEKYSVIAMQGTLNDLEINGSTKITINNLDAQNRLYFNEYNIAQNGIIISNFEDFSDYNYEQMSGTSVEENDNYEYYNKWRRVTNLNQYTAGNRVYKLGIDSTNSSVYIQFPDDIGNLINNGLYIKYILSNGEEGNIGKNDISQIINEEGFSNNAETNPTTISVSDFVVTNTKSSQNGRDPLDIDEMRKEFNKIVGVFNTLVTLRDYENYLYEYEDNNGDHVVSNIRVSDRFNDLTASITYKAMDFSGQILDKTEVLKDDNNDLMTAYDLKFYPLKPVSPIETESDLDKTFETCENLTPIKEVIANVKCINHDVARVDGQEVVGIPVLIPYDLDGQIYLQTAVSSEEASEISSKVQLSLLKSLNSRELDWGSQIDYGNVVDTIKNADNRIQYVALDAISYKEPILNGIKDTFDVIERNILIGNKSWTNYNQFLNDYNETEPKVVGPGDKVSEDSNVTITGVKSIKTDISIEVPASGTYNSYKVNKNETFTVLTPQYNTVTTYGNYLYYIARGDKTDDKNSTAEAGKPYKLVANQKVYIFETRDAAENFITGGENEKLASYILKEGTIIEPSVKIEFLAGSSLPTDAYKNMGSSVTINILERAEGTLRTSDNIASNGTTSTGLSIATNSSGLRSALIEGNIPYTLLSDEYLFYTDDLRIELGIISEGTTIYTEDGKLDSTNFNLLDESNVEDVLNGSILDNTNVWKRINNNIKIKYQLNELSTFGANYLIAFFNKNGEDIENKSVTLGPANKFLELDSNLIRYTQLNEDGSLPSEPEWSELNQTLEGDPYSVLIRMALITGPGVPQEISELAGGEIGEDTGLIIPKTTQSVIFNFNTSDGMGKENTISSGSTLQTNRLITYQGGNDLVLVGDEQNVSYYSYEVDENISSLTYGEDGFIDVASIDKNITSLTIPGVANTASIIPYIDKEYVNTINYAIIKAGTTAISIDNNTPRIATITDINANISKLGRPYVTTANATYYNKSQTSENKQVAVSTILGSNVAAKLEETYLYRNGYCPIYQPTDEDKLDDPTDPSSYFLDQHPYNRYVLPKLDNINIEISPLSITK